MAKKKRPIHRVIAFVLIVGGLVWMIGLRTDSIGMTSWEKLRDAFNEQDWVGWIHPFGEEVGKVVELGPFDSLEQCRSEAFSRMEKSYDNWESTRYYCGYRCTDPNYRTRDDKCDLITK